MADQAQALFRHPEACHRPVAAAHVVRFSLCENRGEEPSLLLRPVVAYVIRRKNSLTNKDFVGIFSEQQPEVIGRHWHDQVLFTVEGRDYHDAHKGAVSECRKRGLRINDH